MVCNVRPMLRNLAVLLVFAIGACVTNPVTGETELDPAVVHAEFVAISGDLLDAASFAEENGDPELGADLRLAHSIITDAHEAVHDVMQGGVGNPLDALDAALAATEALLPRVAEMSVETQLVLFATRGLLRRLKAYAEPAEVEG